MANFSGSRFQNGGQIHWFGSNNADDDFNIILDNRNAAGDHKHDSHHVYGSGGDDVYRFTGFDALGDFTTGRLDTFDPTRDKIFIENTEIDIFNLPSQVGGITVSVVEWKGQQWLRMQNGSDGTAFFALEGARLSENVTDDVLKGDRTGVEERHFYDVPGGKSFIDSLPTVDYENPMNLVPEDDYDGVSLTNRKADVETFIGNGASELIYASKYAGSGDRGSQVIEARGGNDVVQARSGNDTVYGGNGNDTIAGGTDADALYGQSGNDVLYGGTENDYLSGGSGRDVLNGNRDNDTLRGGAEADTLSGGEGEDLFEFSSGDLVRWGSLSGSTSSRNQNIDLIEDFTLGEDLIQFAANTNVDSLSDLKMWKTTISGNVHFTIKVQATNERILVDVDDNVSWTDLYEAENFIFGNNTHLVTDADMLDWNYLNGSTAEKNAQLMVIEDFDIGTDKIRLTASNDVDDLSDLRVWKTTIDGNVMYTVQERATNERILVDVDDNVTWGQMYDEDNFIFG